MKQQFPVSDKVFSLKLWRVKQNRSSAATVHCYYLKYLEMMTLKLSKIISVQWVLLYSCYLSLWGGFSCLYKNKSHRRWFVTSHSHHELPHCKFAKKRQIAKFSMLQCSIQMLCRGHCSIKCATCYRGLLLAVLKVTEGKVTGLDYRQNPIAAGFWQSTGDNHSSVTLLCVIHNCPRYRNWLTNWMRVY